MNKLVSLKIAGRIGVITIDSPPVNALSQPVRQGIVDCLQQANADDACQAIVLACAGRTFIAGADITEFDSGPREPNLNDVIAHIEQSAKPVVAALHGTTLGGGFEVALGCHYRVALASTKVGFPEVLLGLLPGAGGTQRYPRLVGVEAALSLMVSGKPISVKVAAKQGAIDKVVDDDLLNQAIAYAESLVDSNAPLRKLRDEQIAPGSVPAEFYDQFATAIARQSRGYFAPDRIIEAVKAAAELQFDAGLELEAELFMQCMHSPQSAAQRYLFFAERQAARINDLPKDTPLRPIKSVAVIGSGTMGGGIAMNFASKGLPVKLVDLDAKAIERGLAVVRGNYERGVRKGRMTEAQLEQLMNLFQPTTDYADLAEVDLVIEAVFEDMALKKKIFAQLDAVCKPGAILASNTSTLDVDEIAQATKRPQDVVGMHFFSPANVMRLLEVVRGEATAPDVLATVMKLAKQINKVGVVSGVCYGFIGNRMLEGYGRESGMLLLEGASVEQIDHAIYNFGMPMGPMAMGDMAGLDVGTLVRQERRAIGEFPDDERYGLIGDKLVEMGRHGQKTSAGFYRYEAGSRAPLIDPKVSDLVAQEAKRLGIEQRQISDEEIVARCIYPIINEGARILEEGIAQRASDIDIVWINGYGFPPYRGGPMFYADSIGLKTVYDKICEFRNTLGSQFGYWEPAPLLEKLAKQGGRFADF